MANNEWGDFQTPPDLAALAIATLGSSRWSRVLEPTCGVGAFLSAAKELGGNTEALGIEVQPKYVALARDSGFTVLERNIFDLDLNRDLSWRSSGPLLVIGNPPWVTSAQLGGFGSINLPTKSNIRSLRGFDAMTGASNFDIAEFIFLKMMLELVADRPTISMLVKTHVARNILSYAAQFGLPYSRFSIREIDAKAWFGASVDACLFTTEFSDQPSYTCDIFPAIDSESSSRRIGIVNGQMVADTSRYSRSSFADGTSPIEWRSGVKHDASAVMELDLETKEALGLEADYVLPLLKCTDLFRDRLEPRRFMVVPQHQFGEDTAHLETDAPKLWAYLETHADVLDARKSSIYLKQPRFTVFGLGDYTFAPYKIAISGLHKAVHFVLLGQIDGQPVVVDDASYTLPFDNGHAAAMCFALLTCETTNDLLSSLVFWDAKRPINKKLLQRVDLGAIARKADSSGINRDATAAALRLGLAPPQSWDQVLDNLLVEWEQSSLQDPTTTKAAKPKAKAEGQLAML